MYFTLPALKRIALVGSLLVILLIILDLVTYLYYPDTLVSKIFLATREQTPLTWISALTFLFLAFGCCGAYHQTKSKLWYGVALIFFFFSLDDAVYLHERISGFVVDNTELFASFPTYIWIVLYAPLLVFALATLLIFLWKGTSARFHKAIITAVVILVTAISLDLLDGVMEKNEDIVLCLDASCHEIMIHIIRLAEEVLEVLAIGLLAFLTIQKYCIIDPDCLVKRAPKNNKK